LIYRAEFAEFGGIDRIRLQSPRDEAVKACDISATIPRFGIAIRVRYTSVFGPVHVCRRNEDT
jgi:hypothetical protein